jgi:DNA-binding response OmpR family regulator
MKTEHLATILTIDDDANIRQSFRPYLEDHCFKVLEAEDGSIGVDVFQPERPDLVNDTRGVTQPNRVPRSV